MTHTSVHKKTSRSLFVIYLFTFLVSLQVALPAYINSSFIGQFTSEKWVGLIYAIASFLSILTFATAPKILNRFGNVAVSIAIIVSQIIFLTGMVIIHVPIVAIILFISSFVVMSFLGLNLDIFIEKFSRDSVTGSIRGAYMTMGNTAWVISALLVSFILTGSEYWKIFLTGALLLIPAGTLLWNEFRDFKNPVYESTPFIKTFTVVFRQKNLRNIFFIGFLLQFFYAVMVVYTPLYLHNTIGFDWKTLGILFSIMLLPFVLIEIPLGRLADTRFGEKEALIIGFGITALSTAFISFIASSNFFIWAFVLFATRIGASMVEIMSETYFFKNVSMRHAHTISAYRTMRPIAYLMGPLIATGLLLFVDFRDLFWILGAIIASGILSSVKLKDTL